MLFCHFLNCLKKTSIIRRGKKKWKIKGITIIVDVKMKVKILAVAKRIKNGDTLYTFTNGLLLFLCDLEKKLNFISACRVEWKALLLINLEDKLIELDRN